MPATKIAIVIVGLLAVSLSAVQQQAPPVHQLPGAALSPTQPAPSLDTILRQVDAVVMGYIGEARRYLTEDQRVVLTDYSVLKPSYPYQRKAFVSPTAETGWSWPATTVTLIGEPSLRSGMPCMLLLTCRRCQ
jgi:hypothetical protein